MPCTIVGGSKYNAHIVIADNPKAKIIHKGNVVGTRHAVVKVKRNEANRFAFSVKQDGCNEQTYTYHSRTFRGWALVGTIFTWTAIPDGVPLPWGVALDLATGALWKPNVYEKGVSKRNYKNFQYLVNYTSCVQDKIEIQEILDVVYLKNGSIIRGQIIEKIPDSIVKIQTKDGNVFVYKVEEIEKITRE